MNKGALTKAILHIRDKLAIACSEYKWKLLAAENPFQKWNIIATTPITGFIIVSWKSDVALSQAGRSLVVKANLAITLCARQNISSPSTSKIVSPDPASPALMEIHDRIKGVMLTLTLPDEIVPESGAEVPIYGGSVPLTTPDGLPLDGIEQTWEIELIESFSPEHHTE